MPTSRSVAIRIDPSSGSATSLTFWRIGLGLRAGTTPPTIPNPASNPSRLHRAFMLVDSPALAESGSARRRVGRFPDRLGPSSVREKTWSDPLGPLPGGMREELHHRHHRRAALPPLITAPALEQSHDTKRLTRPQSGFRAGGN